MSDQLSIQKPLSTITDKMVEKAIAFCAEKNFAGDTRQTLHTLRRGVCNICCHVTDSLEIQIGEYLGQIDKSVKAIYKYGPDRGKKYPQIQDKAVWKTGINLVVWIRGERTMLRMLGTPLETALTASRRRIGCKIATSACYTLDLKVVNNADVQNRRGFGAIIESKFIRSAQVWPRPEQSSIDVSHNS